MAVRITVQRTFLTLAANCAERSSQRSRSEGARRDASADESLKHLEELWRDTASFQRDSDHNHDLQVVQSEGQILCKAATSRPLGKLRPVSSISSVSTMASFGSLSDLRSVGSTSSLSSMAWADEEDISDALASDVDAAAGKAAVDGSACQAPRSSTHAAVPKHVNLAEEFAKTNQERGSITTLMIRNIPNRCSQKELIQELERAGFANCFDFVYVPFDLGTMSNVGYGFVNFIHHAYASRCMGVLPTHTFSRKHKSGKTIAVTPAHMQGLDANLRHYEKSAVNNSRLRQRRPVVLNVLKTVSLACLV